MLTDSTREAKLAPIVKKLLDTSNLVKQISIVKGVNSKSGGTPMGPPNSKFDGTPMSTPISTTNNRQVRNRFKLELHLVQAVSHQS